jgi:predicted porin
MFMKTTLAAAALMVLSSGAAHAQSVNMYGIVDLGVAKFSRGAYQVTNNKSSRLGFRGQEDLGGGLRASFQLESEVLADNGTADSTFWGRQAWVGLGGEWGQVRMGRTKNPTDDIADEIDPFTTDGIVGDQTKTAWRAGVIGSRLSNAIVYNTPKIRGFRVHTHLVFDELNSGGKKGYGLVATYEGTDFGAVLGHQRPAVTTAGRPQGTVTVGGVWVKFGDLKLSAGLSDGDTKRYPTPGNASGYLLGAEYEMGNNVFKFAASKLRTETGTTTRVKTTTSDNLAVGYDYKLSKRTKLYATALREQAADVTGWQAGVQHRF